MSLTFQRQDDGDCDLWNGLDMGNGQLTKVAEVVTVVEGAEWLEVVERCVEAVGGDGEGGAGADASCCSSVVRVAFSCCCFFFTSCSADFKSSRVTPGEMVDLKVFSSSKSNGCHWPPCVIPPTNHYHQLRFAPALFVINIISWQYLLQHHYLHLMFLIQYLIIIITIIIITIITIIIG